MFGLRGERDLQRAVAGGDCTWIVPFYVARLPVVEVDRFPVRIIAGVERATLGVELVTEDELPLLLVAEVGERVRVL